MKIEQTDYAIISKSSLLVERFQVFKAEEQQPTETDEYYYVPVNQTQSEIIVDPNTGETDILINTPIMHPNAQIGSRYYADIEQFSPVLPDNPWVDSYVFDKVTLEWRPPQMSNDKVTHVWSNFEQDYVPVNKQ
jgi:hypothetical protein